MPESRDDCRTGSAGRQYSKVRRGLAWCVHLLTASGVVCCLFALEATGQSQWRTALAWLVLAVIIDAADGTFARLVDVKAVLPNFDGTLLDNVVDYANYVIVPAWIIHRAHLVPDGISLYIASSICLASCYQFCQNDAKTSDHFFKGFPSYWNVVALYLLALGLSPLQNLAIVAALVVMVFVPIKYIYVTRTREYRTITFPLTAIWAVMALVTLWQLPNPQPLLVWSSMLYLLYYFCISLSLTLRPPPQAS
jgi:phosphatidylcholine synthase